MRRHSFTLVEVMVVTATLAMLVALGIPNLLRSRLRAIESQAQTALKAIASAEITYRVSNSAYGTITELGSATPPYIDNVLGCASPPCTKNGYNFNLPDVAAEYFCAIAQPAGTFASSGRSFCITEDGVIRVRSSGEAITDHDDCLTLPPT